MSPRLLALVLLAGIVPVSAQTPSGSRPAAPAAPAVTPALPAAGFTYDPQGRRDPFVSLLQRGTDEESAAPTVRAPGLAGLGASEVTLKGTLATRGGYVAILQGLDTKTYIVRPGEKLSDGTVRTITPDAVVILQRVKDPLSLDTQREVRKTLRQTEEAK
jgi:Tfp pilus assembly protein PilP